jgi:F-type H+-transporting ATPase subunit alpha
MPVYQQIIELWAVTKGMLDELPISAIDHFKEKVAEISQNELGEISNKIAAGDILTDQERTELDDIIKRIVASIVGVIYGVD